MKILNLAAYYEPERVSSSHLNEDLENGLIASSHEIEIICPTPTRGITAEEHEKYKKIRYEEKKGGKVKVYRFSMMQEGNNPFFRALRYLIAGFVQKRKGYKAENVDVVIGASTPPTQGLLSGKVAKRLSKKQNKKVPFVYCLQDVFPDSLVTTGLAKKGGLLWEIGRKIENKTYQLADKIIVLSETVKQNILNKGVPAEKIVVISNWIDTETMKPIIKNENKLFEEFGIDRKKFVVVYAGNMGAAQGTDVILKSAKALIDNTNIKFVIFGAGSNFENAKRKVSENCLSNIIINKTLPQERVSEIYSLGNIALITCKNGVGMSAMPSKTWSIMACNTRIIASFDIDSELNCILHKCNGGYCVEPENEGELTKAILSSYQDFKEGKTLNINSREYVINNASKEICVNRYISVFSEAVRITEM